MLLTKSRVTWYQALELTAISSAHTCWIKYTVAQPLNIWCLYDISVYFSKSTNWPPNSLLYLNKTLIVCQRYSLPTRRVIVALELFLTQIQVRTNFNIQLSDSKIELILKACYCLNRTNIQVDYSHNILRSTNEHFWFQHCYTDLYKN